MATIKENNANEETGAPTEYGKYVDECLNEASKHFFSEGEDTYSVADLFYAGVRCGKSCLENKGQTFTKKDVDDAYLAGVRDTKKELEKQGERKPQRMISAEAKEAMYGNPAWSEEDEKIIQDIINDIAIVQEQVYCKSRCEDEINWLKSLKQRIKL